MKLDDLFFAVGVFDFNPKTGKPAGKNRKWTISEFSGCILIPLPQQAKLPDKYLRQFFSDIRTGSLLSDSNDEENRMYGRFYEEKRQRRLTALFYWSDESLGLLDEHRQLFAAADRAFRKMDIANGGIALVRFFKIANSCYEALVAHHKNQFRPDDGYKHYFHSLCYACAELENSLQPYRDSLDGIKKKIGEYSIINA